MPVERAGHERHRRGDLAGIGFPPTGTGGSRVTGLVRSSQTEPKAGMVFRLHLLRTGTDYSTSHTTSLTDGGSEILAQAMPGTRIVRLAESFSPKGVFRRPLSGLVDHDEPSHGVAKALSAAFRHDERFRNRRTVRVQPDSGLEMETHAAFEHGLVTLPQAYHPIAPVGLKSASDR